MADKHPYISTTGGLVKAVRQFRTSLPAKIDANVLRKLGLAPRNESYLINVLRFLNVIDEKGAPTNEARSTFSEHDDGAFGKKLSEMIEKAYSELFSLHKGKAWDLDNNALITYFRQSDQTSSVVGGRQARTFQTLAALGGHGGLPNNRQLDAHKRKPAGVIRPSRMGKRTNSVQRPDTGRNGGNNPRDLGLTVRVEINLPVAENQAVYDKIFRSIKENLLHG